MSPQQASVPSVRMPHVADRLASRSRKVPLGGVLCPVSLLPQQATDPSVTMTQLWYQPVANVSVVAGTGVHVMPSPLYPALQAQVKEPAVLVQAALASQLSVPAVHSSTSVRCAISRPRTPPKSRLIPTTRAG